jgi:Uma2 family endonuclease
LLFRILDAHVTAGQLGEVFFAPLPVQLAPTKFREPDVLFLRPERIQAMQGQPVGADLAVEVVSAGKDNWERDYIEKRAEYAASGIAEYWIVDPQATKITVLSLQHGVYREHGVFQIGDVATSVLLEGLIVEVAEVFAKCGLPEGS